MDFDFLNRTFLDDAKGVVGRFRDAVESASPPPEELDEIVKAIRPYDHCKSVPEDFSIGAVDGSGEYPLLQQDDIFLHFYTAARTLYRTESARQNKLAVEDSASELVTGFTLLRDDRKSLEEGYANLLQELMGKTLRELGEESDYCSVYSFGKKKIGPGDLVWKDVTMSQASQIASHAYLIRSIAELGLAVRLLDQNLKYLLLDTSLVYFFLGERIFLSEVVKRYLTSQANSRGVAVLGLCKSHNIPNGDLIGRMAKEKLDLNDHWFVRLKSPALGEKRPKFLQEKEVPPRLGVSYLFKFHSTSFPMRLDMDAGWWKEHIGGDESKERRLFEDLDFTCHDVRSYGYPYPIQAAHRRASLTKQERTAVKDVLMQNAKDEGLLRGAFMGERDTESVHMQGI